MRGKSPLRYARSAVPIKTRLNSWKSSAGLIAFVQDNDSRMRLMMLLDA